MKNTLYILRLAGTLFLITALVALALAGINAITAPTIAQAKEAKTQAAVSQVLPGGGEAIDFTDTTGLIKNVYRSDMGFAIQVTPSGFDGEIDMMVGIDNDGKILGISIISHTETAGLGAVAAANNSKGEAFREQFVGTDSSLSVNKDGGTVDAITGATITSRAVTEGVNTARTWWEANAGKEGA